MKTIALRDPSCLRIYVAGADMKDQPILFLTMKSIVYYTGDQDIRLLRAYKTLHLK